jgi:regulator of replication initiation timing
MIPRPAISFAGPEKGRGDRLGGLQIFLTWASDKAIVGIMEERLQDFLERFAELERRVRKLAVEDRALREEVKKLRQRLSESEAEAAVLKAQLGRSDWAREAARQRLTGLIERLERLQVEGEGPRALEVMTGER